MLPGRDRDAIQEWFIKYKNLERELKRKETWRTYAANSIYVAGAFLVVAIFQPDERAEMLWVLLAFALVGAVLAYFEQGRSIREDRRRLTEIEQRFIDFDLRITPGGRLKTPAGECDPLYTDAYDPDLPPLKSTNTMGE